MIVHILKYVARISDKFNIQNISDYIRALYINDLDTYT